MRARGVTLSLVIPAHNEERRLGRCLAAIASQTVMPDEVIVVDNGSTDGTVSIAQKYPFVHVIHESQPGIVYARNAGFDAAKSGIIARIDADTVLPEGWCEYVRTFYADPGHASLAVTGGCYFYNLRSGRLTGRMYDFVVHRINRLLIGYYFPWGSNTAVPSEAWQKIRRYTCEQTGLHEDLDLGIHLHQAGYDVAYIPKMRIGAMAQRITAHHHELWPYLAMWPQTLRAHRIITWPAVWLIAVLVWVGSYWLLLTETMLGILKVPAVDP